MGEGERPVLVVEDDSNDAFLLQRAFGQAEIDMPVRVVCDGLEATDYLSGTGIYNDRQNYPLPHIVLLDLKMPRMSGLEVLEWMQAQPQLRQIPVLMLTSSNVPSDLKQAKALNARDYLVKPTLFEDLVELVRDVASAWLKPGGEGGSAGGKRSLV